MVMGCETEFGIIGPPDLRKVKAVQCQVLTRGRHLPAETGGLTAGLAVDPGRFLENGGRISIDIGAHLEYSTPEVADPGALLVAELAGRRLAAEAAAAAGVTLTCANVDTHQQTTWGCHENYRMGARPSPESSARLYSHLATRIVFCGAGGLELRSQRLEPVLSPRACRISAAAGGQGVPMRAMVFDKSRSRSYGAPYRLHVMCGESLLSHLAGWLKVASTALVAELLDAGLPVGPGPFAEPPVRALQAISRDLSLALPLRMADGRRLTALDVQLLILEDVARHLDRLPEWAPLAVERWGSVLAGLRDGSPRLGGQLDWLVYMGALWQLAEEMGAELPAAVPDGSAAGPSGEATPRLGTDAGTGPLRDAAAELYIRLHTLGPESLWDRLESQGRLNHRLPEVTEQTVRQAMDRPPPGRAANRALLIRRYSASAAARVSWQSLQVGRRTLQIPWDHDWDGSESWDPRWFLCPDVQQRLHRVANSGRYDRVVGLLCRIPLDRLEPCLAWCLHDHLCMAYARQSLADEADAALARTPRLADDRLLQIAMICFCGVSYSVVPPVERLMPLLAEGQGLLRRPRPADDAHNRYDQARIRVLLALGEFGNAQEACRSFLMASNDRDLPRMRARTRCSLAEALRRTGQRQAACEELSLAVASQRRIGAKGDLAEHSLPILARMHDAATARRLLGEAETMARRFHNPLALFRVLCIKARRLGVSEDRDEVARLRVATSGLRSCTTAGRIVSCWDEWTARGSDACDADYWGI